VCVCVVCDSPSSFLQSSLSNQEYNISYCYIEEQGLSEYGNIVGKNKGYPNMGI